jgi:hypothetical protein
VWQLTRQGALRFNHDYLGTEHILLALVGDTEIAIEKLLLSLRRLRAARLFLSDRRAAPLGQRPGVLVLRIEAHLPKQGPKRRPQRRLAVCLSPPSQGR